MLKGRDLLSIHELTVGEVEEILELAAELKAKQKAAILEGLKNVETDEAYFMLASVVSPRIAVKSKTYYEKRTQVCHS